MTTVSAVAPGTAAATSTKAASPSVDYSAFLKLLITQMKNQDPTKPMDTGQFMAQLATFSQVEQGIITNGKLDQMLAASGLAQADSVIGRPVTSADGATSGTVVSVRITGEGPLATLSGGDTLLLGPGVTVG